MLCECGQPLERVAGERVEGCPRCQALARRYPELARKFAGVRDPSDVNYRPSRHGVIAGAF